MATLKSLVDETTNIKNELVECHTNLKNTLIAKGTECSDNEKMSSLVDKISALKVQTEIPISGDFYLAYSFTDNIYTSSTSGDQIASYVWTGLNGTLKVTSILKGNSTEAYLDIKITRNGNTTLVKTITGGLDYYITSYCDIDVLKGDTILFMLRSQLNNRYAYCNGIQVTHNYLIT